MGSVPPLLAFFLALASGCVHRHKLIVIEFLQAENRTLKERRRGKRIRFTDTERTLLARKAKAVGRKALLNLDTIVFPETIPGVRGGGWGGSDPVAALFAESECFSGALRSLDQAIVPGESVDPQKAGDFCERCGDPSSDTARRNAQLLPPYRCVKHSFDILDTTPIAPRFSASFGWGATHRRAKCFAFPLSGLVLYRTVELSSRG